MIYVGYSSRRLGTGIGFQIKHPQSNAINNPIAPTVTSLETYE